MNPQILLKINRALFFITIIIFSVDILFAQDNVPVRTINQQINFGVGVGLDYGGIGLRLSVLPDSHLSLFAAFGNNLNGAGYNLGVAYRFTPFNSTCWYYTMMYGYNAVIVINNASQYDQTYYGISPGFGIEFHGRRHPGNFFNLEILIPLRTQEYRDDIIALQNKRTITFKSQPLPFTISIGFHFKLG